MMRASDIEPTTLTGQLGFRFGERTAVSVSGPDAESYLQGQLSQDLGAIATGSSAASLLLQPQGKIDAWLRITRHDEESFVLDVDTSAVDDMVARLRRFLLRTDARIEPLDWKSLALRGPTAEAVAQSIEGAVLSIAAPEWSGGGVDVFGPDLTAPDNGAELDDHAWTALRILSGMPAMGAELDADTIPASAGIVDESVSFTKGCYTGQELVARIDSRGGNVPRRLAFVSMSGAPVLPADAEIRDAEGPCGRITSWAPLSEDNATVALAYISRRVDIPASDAAPTAVTVAGPDGPVDAALSAIPARS